MHQYCLLNCACYIINTHTDMTWIWYDKSIRGEELEKEPSECIFHELQSSPAKVLDMMFQSRRRRGARRARRQICGCMKTNLGFHMQSLSHWCVRICDHTSTGPEDFDRPPLSGGHRLGVLFSRGEKKKSKCDTTSSHLFTSTDVLTSDGMWRCCSCWYLIKSEGWISLRVAFSISFTTFLRLVGL